jgi:hypothetical protein
MDSFKCELSKFNYYQISLKVIHVINRFEGKADRPDELVELDRLLGDGDADVVVSFLAQILRMNLMKMLRSCKSLTRI